MSSDGLFLTFCECGFFMHSLQTSHPSWPFITQLTIGVPLEDPVPRKIISDKECSGADLSLPESRTKSSPLRVLCGLGVSVSILISPARHPFNKGRCSILSRITADHAPGVFTPEAQSDFLPEKPIEGMKAAAHATAPTATVTRNMS
jgi:hypothetical protein